MCSFLAVFPIAQVNITQVTAHCELHACKGHRHLDPVRVASVIMGDRQVMTWTNAVDDCCRTSLFITHIIWRKTENEHPEV